jgi:stringent starvation protein B
MKEALDGNIPWSNAFVDENATIDLIVNAMTPTKAMVHISKQGIKVSSSFETLDQVVKNISKALASTTHNP